jgi:hypothetical protein
MGLSRLLTVTYLRKHKRTWDNSTWTSSEELLSALDIQNWFLLSWKSLLMNSYAIHICYTLLHPNYRKLQWNIMLFQGLLLSSRQSHGNFLPTLLHMQCLSLQAVYTYPSLSRTRFLSNFVTLLVLFSGFDLKDRFEKKFWKKSIKHHKLILRQWCKINSHYIRGLKFMLWQKCTL